MLYNLLISKLTSFPLLPVSKSGLGFPSSTSSQLPQSTEERKSQTMTLISDYEGEDSGTKTASSSATAASTPPAKPSTFTAPFDPSNPIGLVEKLFDFVASESDFLSKDSAEKEIAAVVKSARERRSKKLKREKEAAEKDVSAKIDAKRLKEEAKKPADKSSTPPLPRSQDRLQLERQFNGGGFKFNVNPRIGKNGKEFGNDDDHQSRRGFPPRYRDSVRAITPELDLGEVDFRFDESSTKSSPSPTNSSSLPSSLFSNQSAPPSSH